MGSITTCESKPTFYDFIFIYQTGTEDKVESSLMVNVDDIASISVTPDKAYENDSANYTITTKTPSIFTKEGTKVWIGKLNFDKFRGTVNLVSQSTPTILVKG